MAKPPLCPSDRKRRPESEKDLELAERPISLPYFLPDYSEFGPFCAMLG
jgi:hypothetical protein